MKSFKNILVATDTRLDQHPIVDKAVSIAQNNGASLKIVDVIPDFTWTVRLTLKDHQHVAELLEHETREKLEALAASIREKGIEVECKVLKGKTSLEIIREVLRYEHDLVLRVSKGTHSRGGGYFGNTGIRLLRKCPCSVWLVGPTNTKIQHVLGCIDTSTEDPIDAELNDKVFELAKTISDYHGGVFSIIHAWSIWNSQMLKHRMAPEAYAEIESGHHDHASKLLGEFLSQHGTSVDANNVHLLKGEPPTLISEFVRRNEVDLVVMGTVAQSGLSGMIMGNTAERILNSIECSVLALKPSNFVCPISIDD